MIVVSKNLTSRFLRSDLSLLTKQFPPPECSDQPSCEILMPHSKVLYNLELLESFKHLGSTK